MMKPVDISHLTSGTSRFRTDLAAEENDSVCRQNGRALAGVRVEEDRNAPFPVTRITIDSPQGARALQKPEGTYVTVAFEKPWLMENREKEELSRVLSRELTALLDRALGRGNDREAPILVVGLGNRRMTADAIGPETVGRITVTRHLQQYDPPLFRSLSRRSVAAFTPGVLGDTGVESAEMVCLLVRRLRPAAVLVLDALAARSVDRLACTVQLSDAGISPGSGVGNDRPAVNRETLGVPVVAVGVPMIVDSATLVLDALEKAGYEEAPEALRPVLENGRSFFVSVKEADAALFALSEILSSALDFAMEIPARV